MGKYFVEITSPARQHLLDLKKSGQKVLIAKVERIFAELAEHPYEGTGKPEQLRGTNGIWSRRLDQKNRILYTIHEDIVTVYVLSALGHYGDK